MNAQKNHIPANMIGTKAEAVDKYILSGVNFLDSTINEMMPITRLTKSKDNRVGG
ncbi:MAG: hypothetical protein M0Q93_12510 [Terrimicrobiaceae bacterium]|nr:hypothetical protein [Terrimicrobiaceae bacterium]